MPAKIFSASLFGYECRTVEVEVDILNGPASITIVGLGDATVQESKERIRSAIKNSGVEYPRRKKTINLAPADIPKHGPLFDLAIALGLLVQSKQIQADALARTIVIGELALSGEVRPVSGVLSMISHAQESGFATALVPEENAAEAALVENITVIGVRDLRSAIAHLRGEAEIPPAEGKAASGQSAVRHLWNFEDIHGHESVKRALTVAAAGRHNVLLYGPPGSGKTILAAGVQSILPPLSFDEAIEVTKIYSIAGKLPGGETFMHTPPLRAVHHTASTITLIGGGQIPKPGEISLAHNGVLFLDELLEFTPAALNSMRQPLETGTVAVSRLKGSTVFPARFMLIAATNPCPCGYYRDQVKACSCTPSQLQAYRKKLSGPLLDRIDIVCSVPRVPFEKLTGGGSGEASVRIAKCVAQTRAAQYERFASLGLSTRTNGDASAKTVRTHFNLTPSSTSLLKEAFRKMHCSGRAYFRILKVARTIADMEGSRAIEPNHLAEALHYRQQWGSEGV